MIDLVKYQSMEKDSTSEVYLLNSHEKVVLLKIFLKLGECIKLGSTWQPKNYQ